MHMQAFSALPHTGDIIISYLPWLFVIAAIIIAVVVGFLLYSKHKAAKANYTPRHSAQSPQAHEESTSTDKKTSSDKN